MPSIFHGLLLLWINYPAFMTHIRCIILYALKLDFYLMERGSLSPSLLSVFCLSTEEEINSQLRLH